MNVGTNELYDLSKMTEKEKNKLMDNPDVKEIPDGLGAEARTMLRNKKTVKVPVTGNSLAAWAKRVRAKIREMEDIGD